MPGCRFGRDLCVMAMNYPLRGWRISELGDFVFFGLKYLSVIAGLPAHGIQLRFSFEG
jgi:hypothetical protein